MRRLPAGKLRISKYLNFWIFEFFKKFEIRYQPGIRHVFEEVLPGPWGERSKFDFFLKVQIPEISNFSKVRNSKNSNFSNFEILRNFEFLEFRIFRKIPNSEHLNFEIFKHSKFQKFEFFGLRSFQTSRISQNSNFSRRQPTDISDFNET